MARSRDILALFLSATTACAAGCIRSTAAGRAPSAPTNVAATPNVREALVSWGAPADDGGEPILRYRVRSMHGTTAGEPVEVDTPAMEVMIGNLADGTTYTFSVVAENGHDSVAAYSSPVTTFALPGPPANVHAQGGNAMALISWNPPVQDGGAPVLDYRVTCSPGAIAVTVTTTSALLTQLTDGNAYDVQVTARNAVGSSLPASPPGQVFPGAVPGAPTAVTATPGDHGISVSWLAPTDVGGFPLSGFTVTAFDGATPLPPVTTGPTTLSTSIASLVNGKSYVVHVHATNAVGDGPDALSASTVPAGLPAAPSAVTVQRHPSRLSWTPPMDNGGSAITGYIVTPFVGATAGTPTAVGNVTTTSLSTLVGNQTYVFHVRATNATGTGAAGLSTPTAFGCNACGFPGLPEIFGLFPPIAIASGDFDGDGIRDVAVGYASHDIEIYLGTSDGSLSPLANVLNEAPEAIAVGDFNGDGKDDLAVAVSTATTDLVRIYLASGAGTMTLQPTSYDVPGPIKALVTGDFDGDGKADLAAGGTGVFQLRGNGNGTFLSRGLVSATQSPVLVAADLDGDGFADLLIPDAAHEVEIRWGAATNALGGPATIPTTSAAGTSAAVADFDQNGFRDIVTANDDGTVSMLFQTAARTFAPHQEFSVLPFARRVLATDANGDNHADLVVSSDTAFGVLLGQGNGTFSTENDFGFRLNAAASSPSLALADDLDGDGRIDVALTDPAGNGNGRVVLFHGKGDGTFPGAASYPLGASSKAAATGDFNGDLKPDLVTFEKNAMTVFLGDGAGAFTRGGTTPTNGDGAWAVVADFNHDGKADVALAYVAAGGISIFLGNGNGTFAAPLAASGGQGPLYVADLNEDGIPDLVNLAGTTSVAILLGNGDGTFNASTLTASASVAIADFNGDGHLDLATSAPAIYFGAGNGTFTSMSRAGQCAKAVLAADFNADGKVDLVASDGVTVSVCLGMASTVFGNEVSVANAEYVVPSVIADFDRDGAPDILGHGSDGSIAVLVNDGTGKFRARQYPANLVGAESTPAFADFDGDGNIDAAAAHPSALVILRQRPFP